MISLVLVLMNNYTYLWGTMWCSYRHTHCVIIKTEIISIHIIYIFLWWHSKSFRCFEILNTSFFTIIFSLGHRLQVSLLSNSSILSAHQSLSQALVTAVLLLTSLRFMFLDSTCDLPHFSSHNNLQIRSCSCRDRVPYSILAE